MISWVLMGLLVTSLISRFISIDPPGNIFPHLALPAGFATDGVKMRIFGKGLSR